MMEGAGRAVTEDDPSPEAGARARLSPQWPGGETGWCLPIWERSLFRGVRSTVKRAVAGVICGADHRAGILRVIFRRALKRLPTDPGTRPGLLGQLSEVLAEQESRPRIANASVSRESARGL
jgi:hypothetical protein